ncbi:MAG TPA: AMP-binding protein [Chloroflexia bacterium]|nr:AMP-binding protein [Chloroflexia bacterium]
MIDTAFAQLRLAASLLFGIPFSPDSLERLVAALRETRHEFGSIGAEGAEMVQGPPLDDAARGEMQFRRFRAQATRAARETAYYRQVFDQLGLDPARMTADDLIRVPLTRKEAVRANPDSFVRHSARPYLRCTTTGTTGTPTSIYFSSYEMRVYFAFTAIGSFFSGDITDEDIVQISTSARGTLGNVCLAGACAHLGAITYLAGVVDPIQALALLADERHLPGKRARTSILYTYPSYLGQLIETGLRLGYKPTDFGLRRILAGGEVVTAGLRARSAALFGDVLFSGGYGMTEIWPFGGTECPDGHLHFEPTQGLLEVLDPATRQPAAPGALGTIVATPLPPYRETTLVLRYQTEDAVRQLATPPTCRLRHHPACGPILGKLRLAVRHADGGTFPRDILEAVEAEEAVPLPGRCGFWAVPGGVAVEVVVRDDTPAVRAAIGQRLEAQGVPLRELHLYTDLAQLQHPLPLRGDLREQAFALSPLPDLLAPVEDR